MSGLLCPFSENGYYICQKIRKSADARAGHQPKAGDKEKGSVLMHAQVISQRLVTEKMAGKRL